MAGTYGEPGKNPYAIPGIGGILSNVVDSQTGVTQIYRQGPLNTFQSIGTFNPKTGGITPDPKANLSPAEQTALSKGKTQIQNAATATAKSAGATNPEKLLSPNKSQSGSEEDNPTTVEGLKSEVQDSGDLRKSYPGKSGNPLVYPITRDPKQDYIKFTMLRYAPKSVNTSESSVGQGSVFGNRPNNREILGRVSLPVQPNISDTNMVQWGESRMNALEAKAGLISLNFMKDGNAGKAAEAGAETVTENAGPLKALTGTALAEKAVGNESGNLFTRITGGIVNPNLELLFQGPQLRSFTFTFTLSAREPDEAKVIKQIIRFFKQGMSVKRAKTSLFLMSPNTFEISYVYGEKNEPHPWMNRIKECALQNFTVNYTPAGNYATFEDGAMTQYDLTLSFGELDPIYDDDYKKLDGNSDKEIGY